MRQENEKHAVIDLGSVSAETRGGIWVRLDTENTLSIMAGLTDD